MQYGLYLASEGANAQTKRLEVLANNLANVNTTAFKREFALFEARPAEAIVQGIAQEGAGSINDLGGGVRMVDSVTDFSPGAVKQTGNPTDLALECDGFFVVNKHGQQMLTRAGNFLFNQNGVLVDPAGDPVLSDAGTPIVVEAEAGPWQFTPDGSVQQGANSVNLAIVRPQSLGDLAKQGENMYLPLSPPLAVPPEERRIVSGSLEASGSQPTLEMMELIESTRAFEANVSMVRNYDQMMSTLVDKLLKES
jgi:flagellar basal body rod protein FlgG